MTDLRVATPPTPKADGDRRRRAAIVATAVALPVVVVVALLLSSIGGGSSTPAGPPPDLTLPAPPNVAAQAAACTKVLADLPVMLGRLSPRVVHTRPATPFVVAWGDPAVVLACGAARPTGLRQGSSANVFAIGPASGPFFLRTSTADTDTVTTVDRAAYITITVPTSYQGSDIITPLARAIARALPAVCSGRPEAPAATSCLNRR